MLVISSVLSREIAAATPRSDPHGKLRGEIHGLVPTGHTNLMPTGPNCRHRFPGSSLARPREMGQLSSKSLRCVVLWYFVAKGVAVVDAPLLERLFLLEASPLGDTSSVIIKIACAPNLRALGYLEPRFHRLQIGNIVINPATKPSQSTMVPGVKILALKINFGVIEELEMMISFLKSFPNIETLHIESLTESTGSNHDKFWQETTSTVTCIKSHLKKLVIHEYTGSLNELEFLLYISRTAQELENLDILLNRESLLSGCVALLTIEQLADLKRAAWSCDYRCKMMVPGHEYQNDWTIHKASDLTVEDPFYWRTRPVGIRFA